MENLQFIVHIPYDGVAQTVVRNGKVVYSELTIDAYLEANPGTHLVSCEELKKLNDAYHTTSFLECTKDEWYEYYCQLPPQRPRMIQSRYFVDYCSEAYSGTIHSIYLNDKKDDKFYTCRMNIFSTDESIIEKFEREILNKP